MPPKEEENFAFLLNKVHKTLFSYLSFEELLSMKLKSRQIKDIVNSYMNTNESYVLKMPPNIKYTLTNINNLDENIKIRCMNNFGKTPPECKIYLQSNIFYDKKGSVSSTIPLKALQKISKTGIKILLSITIDSNNLSEKELWEVWSSYNIIIAEKLKSLPNIESLEISFLNENIRQEENDKWFEQISEYLKKLQHLTSLKISGKIYWVPVLKCISSMTQLTSLSLCGSNIPEDEFITCISSMTQLLTLNISEATLQGDPLFNALAMIKPSSLGFFSVKIIEMDILEFARRFNSTIPELVKLKLSNSYVNSEQIYEALRLLQLANITSLDLSNNYFNTMNFKFEIVPALTKLTSLTSLDLSDNEIDVESLLPIFASLNNLVNLNLKNNSIKSENIQALIPSIQRMPFLSFLNLSSNQLDQDTINELRKQLVRVKKIDTSDNSLFNIEDLD